MPVRGRVGLWFRRYTAVLSNSPHSRLSRPLSINMDRTFSRSVRFIRSLCPFCSGVCGTVASHQIPDCLSSFWKSLLEYSPPLSVRRRLILQPDSFSTIALKSRKRGRHCDFSFMVYAHVYLVKSSVNVT